MEINVTVSGMVGTGKSTIARLIELALLSYKVPVSRIDNNGTDIPDERQGVIETTFEKRLAAMLDKGLSVNVKTVQLGRGQF